MRRLATLKFTQNFHPRNRQCCFSIFRKIIFVALFCKSCKFSAETNVQYIEILLLFFTCKTQIFQRSSKAFTQGDFKSRSRNSLSTVLASLSEKTLNDNSSICCLFSDFVWEASLPLPLVFALGVFFSVGYQNFCIQRQLFLRHCPQLRFQRHLIPKKNQEKRNLYRKILRTTSPVRPPF